jgi:outer membrane protein assembly factor BamB
MDLRPLLRLVAVAVMVAAIVFGGRTLRRWPRHRLRGIIAGALLAALAVSGCALAASDRFEPRAPLPASATIFYTITDDGAAHEAALYAASAATGPAHLRWRYPLGMSAAWPPAFDHDNGTLYIGVRSSIHAIRARDGSTLWIAPVQGRADPETPALSSGVVYATSTSGIVALRASDGQQLWYTSWGGAQNITSPQVADGIVYVSVRSVADSTTPQSSLVALSAGTGAIVWMYALPRNLPASYSGWTVAAGDVYLRTYEGVVALQGTDGRLLWQRQDLGLGVGSAPVVANGLVYVGACPGQDVVRALDVHTGSDRWRTPADPQGKGCVYLTVAGDTLYASSNGISALRASDGHLLWQTGTEQQYYQSVLADGVIFVGSGNLVGHDIGNHNDLTALDAHSGALYWRSSVTTLFELGIVT